MNANYHIAQICENGHVITSLFDENPQNGKKFCTTCGEKTITNCQNVACNAIIKGFDSDGFSMRGYRKPNFCDNCGTAYPWTSRAQVAANELIDVADQLSEEDKEGFKRSVNDLTKSSASATVAAVKYKNFIAKAGNQIGSAMKDVLVDVVSESVKKAIWGPGA